LSHIQSAVGTGDEDGIGGQKETSDTNWWWQLNSNSAWPWIIICVIIVLSLCIALIVISRNGSSARKQMSDLDVLDNYKQGLQ
jgi:hypothetical protein